MPLIGSSPTPLGEHDHLRPRWQLTVAARLEGPRPDQPHLHRHALWTTRHHAAIATYAEKLREVAHEALEEEAVLVVVIAVYHVE